MEKRLSRIPKLPRVKRGDLLYAKMWNQHASAIESLGRAAVEYDPPAPPKFLYVQLLADLLPPTAIAVDQSSSSSSGTPDPLPTAEAAVLIWNHATQNWARSGDRTIQVSQDVYGHNQAVFDAGDMLVVWYNAQALKWFPFFGGNIRIAMTVEDANGDYPDEDDGTHTYPIAFCDASYFEEVGGPSTINAKSQEPQAYAHNIYRGDFAYLPIGTLVPVWWQQHRWYTNQCLAEDNSLDIDLIDGGLFDAPYLYEVPFTVQENLNPLSAGAWDLVDGSGGIIAHALLPSPTNPTVAAGRATTTTPLLFHTPFAPLPTGATVVGAKVTLRYGQWFPPAYGSGSFAEMRWYNRVTTARSSDFSGSAFFPYPEITEEFGSASSLFGLPFTADEFNDGTICLFLVVTRDPTAAYDSVLRVLHGFDVKVYYRL